MRDVTVIVQTCPDRRIAAVPTLDSLRASDVGDDFLVMEHPEGVERCRFFRSVLVKMAEAPAEYVIRCEDDILVNRHLLHNFLTWPALREPMFGAGWLYVSEMALAHTDSLGSINGHPVRNWPIMYGSLCVGMRTEQAKVCLRLLDSWIEKYGCPLAGCAREHRCSHVTRPKESVDAHGQDTLLSRAAWESGKRVFYHVPVLAENRLIESVRGTKFPPGTDLRHLRAGPRFSAEWKR